MQRMTYEAPTSDFSIDRPLRFAEGVPGVSAGERIVVVDDHAELAGTLAEVLTLDGFDVRTAANGDAALAVIAEHNPICVLTDIDMPGMNGFELVRRLRELYESDMVFIAITGWGTTDARIAKEFDAFDYTLRKPIDLAFLRQLLRPA
jgi:DNA-binding response OmpR family regulator